MRYWLSLERLLTQKHEGTIVMAEETVRKKKNKNIIASRLGRINLFFMAVILFIVTAVSIWMLLGITDDASKTQARLYSVEAVDILGSQLSREIALLHHASESGEIINWFSAENDSEKRNAAFNRMMSYADFFQINSLYFVIHRSLNEYYIKAGASPGEFTIFDVIDPSDSDDQWYFITINSEHDFFLNMDMDVVSLTRRLWINYKVTDNGEILGVFCSALEFDKIFYELFSNYDSKNVKGYIIDHEGNIKINSSKPAPEFDQTGGSLRMTDNSVFQTDYEFLSSLYYEQNILDVCPTAESALAVREYLDNTGGFYNSLRAEPRIISLSKGNYRYMSLAPIPNTNWSTVTLYNSQSLFSITRLLPPVIVILLSFVIYTALSTALIRKILLVPLQKLTASVLKADLKNNEISGVERDDEIGDLAKTMQKTWKRFNKNNETLMTAMNDRDQRDQLLHTINIVASILLDSDIPRFERSLYRSMGMMAATVDADRVYIWKNSVFSGELCATQIYEWSERSQPQQGKDYTINVPYREKLPLWGDMLSKGRCINSFAAELQSEWTFFTSAGVLSIFLAPVFLHDEFWGFIGFDNCHEEKKFSEEEAAILRSGCMMIASAFLRHNYITEIVDLQANLKDALKEAQTASRAKSAFLAQMSHEIRTPMNSIIGFSELAMDDKIPVKTKDYLGKIIDNSQWLLQIINDVLDHSKIESGKMEMENIPFDLSVIFTSCKTLISPKAADKGILLHFYVEPLTGRMLLGDPTRLRQVFINLLSNAVKFTNAGVIKAYAEIKKIEESNVTIYFEVNDSGIGMTEEQIKKIFDPFTQAESGTTRKYGGIGLGLPITKDILELMGGELTVKSKPDLGSAFGFTLVFKTINVTEDEMNNSKNILNEIQKPLFDGEVLLCEDNAMNQQVICEHLARIGLNTIVAENGKTGVDIVQERIKNKEKLFDIILMDIHMPVMDGLEASSRILAMDTGIPVVALTANIMASDQELYKANGIADFVGKPFTSQELWRCLLRYLKPVSADKAKKGNTNLGTEEEFNKKLKVMFYKMNHEKYNEITAALKDDIKLAHRMAHTLKSNAGQIGERDLQLAAADVERQLENGVNNVTERQLSHLENELQKVINELSASITSENPLMLSSDTSDQPGVDYARLKQRDLKMLEELFPLLRMGNPESSGYLESIRAINGNTQVYQLKNLLIQQIDDFDFDPALSTFAALKEEISKA